jgi:hypothetical protein
MKANGYSQQKFCFAVKLCFFSLKIDFCTVKTKTGSCQKYMII